MSRDAFQSLLTRYLSGQCSKEENDLVEHWYGILDDDKLPEIEEAEFQLLEQRLWERIRIQQEEMLLKEVEEEQQNLRILPLFKRISAYAAVVAGLFLLFSYLFADLYSNSDPDFVGAGVLIERINSSSRSERVVLADGSEIILESGAKLSFPKDFLKGKREVRLEGSAFFNIAKDPHRPFLVYSDQVVTRVLGTSFSIARDQFSGKTVVAVKTGKVEVSERAKPGIAELFKPAVKVILTPNQETVYSPQTRDFDRKLIDHPLPVKEEGSVNELQYDFNYADVPVGHILNQLEEAYRIEIVVENKAIAGCTFTGDLNEEELFKKLDFICQSIKARYQIEKTRILIKGGECN